MPQLCQISSCSSISIALCLCCNQYICRDHFIEHDHLLRMKLNNLTKEINEIDTQFKTFDIEKIDNDWMEKLDQWRFDSYEIIDRFYEKKYEEFNDYIQQILNKHEDDIIQLKFKAAKMINSQQTTIDNLKFLTSDIQILQKQINQLKHMSFELHIDSLILKDDSINISISSPYSIELLPPYEIIDRLPLTSDAICSNNQYLLIHQSSRLYFLDKNLSIINESLWPYHCIRDICWSDALNSFILLTSDDVYLVEQEKFSIERIQTIEGQSWQSCTCSKTCLYLSKDSWNSSIEEFSLIPSIKFLQRFETGDKKQRIDSIEYNNETLALVINDQAKRDIFIELRSLKTFDRLWLCRFSIEYSERKLQCCLMMCNAWMVADWGSSSIFHLTENGKIKETIKSKNEIRYIHLFGTPNKLIISTNNSINFHCL